MSKIVRLHPRNKKAGYFMAHYTVQRKKFVHGKWYEVDDEVAVYLSGIHSRPGSPEAADSKLCFTICDNRKQALAFVRAEEKAALKHASSRRPGDLTTKDLAEGTHREVDITEGQVGDTLEDLDDDSPEQVQPRRARALRNHERRKTELKEKKAAKNNPKASKETPAAAKKRKAAEKKKAAAEEAKALKELDAAGDDDGEGDENKEADIFD